MTRSIKKAVAFVAFLAMMVQLFVPFGVTDVYAAETFEYVVDNGWINSIPNVEKVVIPSDMDIKGISISLYEEDTSKVKSITLPDSATDAYIYGADSLEELIIPDGLSNVDIYGGGFSELVVPASVTYFTINNSSALKDLKLSKGLEGLWISGCPNAEYTVPATVEYLSVDSVDNIVIDSDNPYYSFYEGSLYYEDTLYRAANKEILNIKEGTKTIGYNALCNCYATTTINMPDSVEVLEASAFAGASNVKKLSLSKNLVTIWSYAFNGVGAASIKIPASVEYVDSYAFNGYTGNIAVEDGGYLGKYEGGIYIDNYASLIYYPKNKSSLVLHPSCTSVIADSINGCGFKTLDIPEGVTYFGAYLDKCTKLTQISIPASVEYIDSWVFAEYPPIKLKKFIVDADNEYYSAYDGCLYSKDREVLYAVPFTKKKVKVCRGCVTIDYYALSNNGYYDYEKDEYIARPDLEVTLAATVSSISSLYAAKKVYAECGTTSAGWLKDNSGWLGISYEFTTTSKKILSMFEFPDDMVIKKDKTASINYSYPSGLNVITSALNGSYNNTYAKISFTSSDKSVAKVDTKTQTIKGLKKGKATITCKIVMVDGKSKKFKIKVKVK